MVVLAGEVDSTDMQDVWALDIEAGKWFNLQLPNPDNFKPKRFHTACSISGNRVVTFGGCHSEYVHLNHVNVFDLSAFTSSDGAQKEITCQLLKFDQGQVVPSSRWGHSAAVYEDNVYIVGGRNDVDLCDLFCLESETMKWHEIKLKQPLPKPRRRHSSIFVNSSLVMFGGFDGDFFNDLHILHMKKQQKSSIMVAPSCLKADFASSLLN